MSDVLSYEALVEEFEEGLLTKLRGHRSAAAFLEMWVPDEDPVRSLLSMFEAAEMAGEAKIAIRIAAATLAGHAISDVAAIAADFGPCSLEPEPDGWLLRLALQPVADPLLAVAALFRKRLSERLAGLKHVANPGAAPASGRTLSVEASGASLALAIGDDREVLKANHGGAADPVSAAVLDYLCEVLAGLPIEEASDHGCHRLIAALQEDATARPVAGVVLPQNADPIFATPLALCQAIKPAWIKSGGDWPEDNFFADPPSAAWLALSDTERREKVESLLAEDGAAQLVSIGPSLLGHPTRVVITLDGDLASEDKPAVARRIERLLGARVEPRLEVYVEELKDQSGIRRL